MSRLGQIAVCLAIVALLGGPLPAQETRESAAVVKREAQNKLLAQRAARVDAIRKLAERIKGLTITSETTVRDFVTESDVIEASLRAFLNGVREKKVTYMEDGTCEVVMEVTLRDVIVNLRQIHERYYKGDRVKILDFEKMLVTYKDQVITETGAGAPRSEQWEQSGAITPVTEEAPPSSPLHMSPGAKAFWTKYCQPRGRLMALRAARVDGLRRLAERIKGVFITSETTVRDFVTESDQIDVSMETFIAGARETGIRYHEDELIVEVEMSVKLRTIYGSLKTWAETHYKGDKVNITRLEKLTLTAEDKMIRETGMGVPPEQYLTDAPAEVISVVKLVANNLPDWVTRKVRAMGNAALDVTNENLAQAKLMALRGAELDGRRKIAEQINGLMITSNTSVVDFVAQNDQIETSMLTFQQGGHVVEGSQKIADDGTAEATVEVDLKPLWDMIVYYQRTLKITIK